MNITIDVADDEVDIFVWSKDQTTKEKISTGLTNALEAQIRLVLRSCRYNQKNGPYDKEGNPL